MKKVRPDRIEVNEYTKLLRKGHEAIQEDYENEGTIDRYHKGWRYWLAFCEDRDDIDPWDASADDVRKFVRKLDGDKGTQAIKMRTVAMSQTYRVLVEEDILDQNPMGNYSLGDQLDRRTTTTQRRRVANEQGPRVSHETITPDQFEELLDNVPEPRLRNQLIARIMWQCMLRPKEITTIQIEVENQEMMKNEDDDEHNWIGHINPDKNIIWTKDAKKDKDDDDLWYRSYYRDSLQYQLDLWLDHGRHEYSPKYSKQSKYLFITDQNEQMRAEHVSRIIKRAAKRAGINYKYTTDAKGDGRWAVTGHTLRRSVATYLANETDFPLHMLADCLNHRSVDTTRNRYIDDTGDDRRSWKDNIDDLSL